ncbi:hypothetical protein [Paenibacillus sp. FSL R5-192]|uniref:hypothetical protein n=1 Tax=Paenibacillus sp. FSL R5-192 TaxID=1226754 RepID=UPI001F363D08|nr:hypothetical protein [Paenibacillus sp. FSL R5-192]
MEKMMWWIEKHLDYEIRLGKMAADVHLSKSYVSAFFIKRQVAALRITSQLEG